MKQVGKKLQIHGGRSLRLVASDPLAATAALGAAESAGSLWAVWALRWAVLSSVSLFVLQIKK